MLPLDVLRPIPPDGPVPRTLAWLLLGVALMPSACSREALPEICPVIEEGELVISELRAADGDTFGHYIELYNAAGKTVDLQGLHIIQRESGGDVIDIFVRESLEVAAGDYVVIGPGGDEQGESINAWIDYALRWDISGGTPDPDEDESFRYPDNFLRSSSAFIELEACGELIDEVFYGPTTLGSLPLPEDGSLACGNADNPPRAEDNDNAATGCWCVDEAGIEDQPFAGVGLPGSPGSPNRCP